MKLLFLSKKKASYDSKTVLTVIATDRSGMKLANFSNWGATAAAIAAPGEKIPSTVPGGNNYAIHDGTSQAAAQVAGAAALLLAARRQAGYSRARAADVRDDLLLSARKIESLKDKCSSGGTLDVAAAMARIPKEGPRDPKESAWLRGVAERTANAAGTEGRVASTMPLSAALSSSSSSQSSPLLLSRDEAAAAAAVADATSRRRDGLAATAAAAGGRLPSTAHTAADAAALASAAAGGSGNSALPVAVGKGGATSVAAVAAVSVPTAAKKASAPAPAPSLPLPPPSSSSSSSSSSGSRVSSFPEIVPGDRSTLARGGHAATAAATQAKTPSVASASVAEDVSAAVSSPKTAPLASYFSSTSALPSLFPPLLLG